MRREKLADCEIGDWVAMIDTDELAPAPDTALAIGGAADGSTRHFSEREVSQPDGDTLFGWVRYDPAKPLPRNYKREVPEASEL